MKTLEGVHSALQWLYSNQLVKAGKVHVDLKAYPAYSKAYNTISNGMAEKGKRTAMAKDPQDGTAEDALNYEEMALLAEYLMKDTTSEASRDLAMCMLLFSCVGRSDDARLMYLCDIVKPSQVRCIGENLQQHIVTCIQFSVHVLCSLFIGHGSH